MKTLLKKHIKKLIPIAMLALPVASFAAGTSSLTPSLNPASGGQASGLSIESIVRAVEQGVGNVIVYPMKQFANTLKYTLDTRAEQASIATQSRFVELSQLQLMVNQNNQTIAKQFAGLNALMASNPLSAQAALTQSDEYCSKANGIFGKKTCFSASSANNFLDNSEYQSKEQAQAAEQYLHTAAGAYLSEKAPSKDWNPGNPDVISYNAFYKTTRAIQSLAQHNLSYAYSIRLANGKQPSELSEYNQVMTGDSSNPGFWRAINKIPVVGQLVTIANYMPTLAVGISQENKYLEMINNSLSVMLIQQNMLSEKAFGGTLYQAADAGSQADNGQQSNNSDSNDSNNNNANQPSSNSGDNNNSQAPYDPSKDYNPHGTMSRSKAKRKAAAEAAKHPGEARKAERAAHSHPKYPGE